MCVFSHLPHVLQLELFGLVSRLQLLHPQLQLLLVGLQLQTMIPALLSGLAVRSRPVLTQQVHAGLDGCRETVARRKNHLVVFDTINVSCEVCSLILIN